MKVARAPYTLLVDQKLCELAILCGGIRMAMTGEEAVLFWAEIGGALQQLYADRPEQCPPLFAAFLIGQLAGESRSAAKTAAWPADPGLESLIDYARRPVVPPESAAEHKASAAPPASRPGESVLGRMKDAFKMGR
jgi:hypothetical protein